MSPSSNYTNYGDDGWSYATTGSGSLGMRMASTSATINAEDILNRLNKIELLLEELLKEKLALKKLRQ